jgi:hypothetical protein
VDDTQLEEQTLRARAAELETHLATLHTEASFEAIGSPICGCACRRENSGMLLGFEQALRLELREVGAALCRVMRN